MGLIKMYPRTIQYKLNGPGTEELAQGYVATPKRYSTISVEDLADHIASDSHVERSKVAVITDSLIKQIREMVLNGHSIKVPHLGTFKPKIKSELAPNPESIDASSFTAKVTFTPSVELKRELQASRIEKVAIEDGGQPSEDESLENLKRYFIAEVKKYINAHKADFEGYPEEPLNSAKAGAGLKSLKLKNGSVQHDTVVLFWTWVKDQDKAEYTVFDGIAVKKYAGVWRTFSDAQEWGPSFENFETGEVNEGYIVLDKPFKTPYFFADGD